MNYVDKTDKGSKNTYKDVNIAFADEFWLET